MKFVKRFYYLAVLMGIMGIYNNASMPDGLGDSLQIKEIQSVKEFFHFNKEKQIASKNVSSVNKISSESNVSSVNKKPSHVPVLKERVKLKSKIANPAASVNQETVANYDSKTGLYEINGKPYVYFKAAYRPYKEKNIYYIDGVYYNYTPKLLKSGEKVSPTEGSPVASSLTKNNTLNSQNLKVGAGVAPQTGGLLNANNLTQLTSELAKAKKNLEYKNQSLEQLLKE